jgi:hypothetical protein
MDNDLELDADFPLNMVVVMQKGVARKAHKMVIKRTIEARLMIKVLNNCLKLHLSTSFISAILLMCGFFEALFLNEEGAKATQKFTSVEWSSMKFLSLDVMNFNSNI